MEEKIKKILSEVIPDFEEYTGTDMVTDGLLDSVQLLEIIAEIEEEFKLEVPAEEMVADNFRSVQKIKEFIMRI